MTRFLSAALCFALTTGLLGQMTLVPDNGGNGQDGAFVAVGLTTLDSSVQSLYQFTSFLVPMGTTVQCVGPNPVLIRVQGVVQIDGVLESSGLAGGVGGNNLPGGAGGIGGAGAGTGGDGGCHPNLLFSGSGAPGTGASPGQPGTDTALAFTDPVGGGGGGGNATAGANGGPPNNATTLLNSSGMGGPAAPPCQAGSGGGGGACDIDSPTVATSNDGGGGGGGGGGWIILTSNASIAISATGSVRVDGGAGGTSSGNGGGGGGGSGGRIDLAAPLVQSNGVLSAVGGAAGGATQAGCGCSPGGIGGEGCIVVSSDNFQNSGPANPAPLVGPNALLLNLQVPIGTFAVTTANLSDTYLVLASFSLSPAPIPTPFGPFLIEFNDFLFNLLYPVNQIPSVFGPNVGVGLGSLTVNLTGLGITPRTEAVVLVQGLSVGMSLSGVSNVLPVRIDF